MRQGLHLRHSLHVSTRPKSTTGTDMRGVNAHFSSSVPTTNSKTIDLLHKVFIVCILFDRHRCATSIQNGFLVCATDSCGPNVMMYQILPTPTNDHMKTLADATSIQIELLRRRIFTPPWTKTPTIFSTISQFFIIHTSRRLFYSLRWKPMSSYICINMNYIVLSRCSYMVDLV